LMPSAAEAGEQAAAAALKEASEHGGAVSAGARAALEVPHGTGAGAAAESPSGTGAGEAVGDANAEPSAEELYQKAQDISDRYGRGQERFLESMHQKTEAALTQTRLDQLATLHKGEGVIAVFRRQLEAMPEKFGFTGDMSDVDAIHNWAEKQAAALSIKEGYWDPTTGKQVWTRWDPNTTVRFNVEGDVEHGLKVAESGTEGSKFIYEPTTAATEVFGKGVSTAGRGVLEAAERTGAVAKAAAARGLEATPPPPLPVVEGAAGLSPEAPGVIDVAHTVSDFPKDVQPYAIYLEAKVKAAQVLLEQYASDPVLGPAARNAFDQVRDDIGAFVKNVDAGKLDAYKGFSGTGFNVVEELRGAIEKVAGVKLPGAEAVASTDVFDMAGLLKGGRIAIEKSWGLKFETVGGRVTPIIDAPRADIDRVVEAHAGMKTDGWLNKDSLNSLIERNDHLASVPQIRLAQIDYLIRALDHLKDTGAGLSEAAGVVKRTIRVMMGNISETVNKVPEDIFTRAFLDRVK
ncbi:MAG: hypothetical protein NTU97_03960, partial [Candidatus Magasanikbacteria bacterium]|nr:hypothetical protein [Candidatus Magasanikbacteria bacterium]